MRTAQIFDDIMITLQDLSSYLETLLSPSNFVDGCPNGLQVEGKREIRKMACAVSASLAVIRAAAAMKADLLLVHHGLFWNKEPLPILSSKRDKLALLLGEGISLMAFHLPLDAHEGLGNNWKAARDLGWNHLEPFGFIGKVAIGVKGRFSPRSVEEFQKELESYYGHVAHKALGGKEKVSTAALISGGAHREIGAVADQQLDCYITGSFDEPVWDIAHERSVNFFALGHYATEKVGIRALGQALQEHFKIPCEFIDRENPF